MINSTPTRIIAQAGLFETYFVTLCRAVTTWPERLQLESWSFEKVFTLAATPTHALRLTERDVMCWREIVCSTYRPVIQAAGRLPVRLLTVLRLILCSDDPLPHTGGSGDGELKDMLVKEMFTRL